MELQISCVLQKYATPKGKRKYTLSSRQTATLPGGRRNLFFFLLLQTMLVRCVEGKENRTVGGNTGAHKKRKLVVAKASVSAEEGTENRTSSSRAKLV